MTRPDPHYTRCYPKVTMTRNWTTSGSHDEAQHPSRRAASHSTPTATQSPEQLRQPLPLAAHPIRRSLQVSTTPAVQSWADKHASSTTYSITTQDIQTESQPLNLAHSPPNKDRSPQKVRFAANLEQTINGPTAQA